MYVELAAIGAGQIGAAVWAPPIGRSPFGRRDIWAPGQMGAAVSAPDVTALDNKLKSSQVAFKQKRVTIAPVLQVHRF